MQQLDLTDPPIARRSDPEPSLMSAHRFTGSGRRAQDQAHLLAVIHANPCRTACELADIMVSRGTHWMKAAQIASKRVSDLAAKGLIRSIGRRVCTVSGHVARVWVDSEQ